MATREVFRGYGGWWAELTSSKPRLATRIERGPYRFAWMAHLAFPILRWTW
jgi:hypothetical protein